MPLPFDQPVLDVKDEHGRRHVKVLLPQQGLYRDTDFYSDWPTDLLLSLAKLKQDWFVDSYARFEYPNYVQKQVDVILDLYKLSLQGKRLLDFGCGFGVSSYCFIRRGCKNIVAADLVRENTDFAQIFFERQGVADFVDVRHEDVVPGLRPAEYDVIWLQAVIEHLLPEERREYLPRFWQALRPGGVLVITETPNRLWPRETHTTGRWWIPWLRPDNVFSQLRRETKYQRYSDEDFYRSGVIGSSYHELMNCLGHPADCEDLGRTLPAYFATVYQHAEVKSTLRTAAVRMLGFVEPVLKLASRRHVTAFLPFLNHLAFRKQPLASR